MLHCPCQKGTIKFDHQNSGGIAGHLSSHFLISSWGVLWHFETSLVLYQLRLQVYISLKQILGHIYIYIIILLFNSDTWPNRTEHHITCYTKAHSLSLYVYIYIVIYIYISIHMYMYMKRLFSACNSCSTHTTILHFPGGVFQFIQQFLQRGTASG